jgi:hypothetical protein
MTDQREKRNQGVRACTIAPQGTPADAGSPPRCVSGVVGPARLRSAFVYGVALSAGMPAYSSAVRAATWSLAPGSIQLRMRDQTKTGPKLYRNQKSTGTVPRSTGTPAAWVRVGYLRARGGGARDNYGLRSIFDPVHVSSDRQFLGLVSLRYPVVLVLVGPSRC